MDNEAGLDLREFFLILKKRIALIIIITLTAAFISAIITVFFISPVYEAEAGIIISKQSDGQKITASDVNLYQNLMQTYKDIADTNYVAEQAAKILGEGADARDLMNRTTVTVKTGTMILTISTKSYNADDAYKEVTAYADAFINRAGELFPDGDVKIMDYARMPQAPASPNLKFNIAVSFLLGLLISVGLAFLLEYMNNKIVTKNDTEKYLKLSIIGIIPENIEESSIKASELIMYTKPNSPVSEAYRTVRTNINFSSIDKEIRTILITSPQPQEGKTTTSCNIALAFSQTGKKTLIMDCDLRKPKVHRMFNISGRTGVTNIMADKLELKDIVYSFSDTLDVLPSGTIPPNPSEILSSNKMKIFLEEVSKAYEKIIIDSPPINTVTDAQVLSGMTDGVILVIGSGITNIEDAKRARELLLKAKANVLGTVLRRLRVNRKLYEKSGYYYYSEEEGRIMKIWKSISSKFKNPSFIKFPKVKQFFKFQSVAKITEDENFIKSPSVIKLAEEENFSESQPAIKFVEDEDSIKSQSVIEITEDEDPIKSPSVIKFTENENPIKEE